MLVMYVLNRICKKLFPIGAFHGINLLLSMDFRRFSQGVLLKKYPLLENDSLFVNSRLSFLVFLFVYIMIAELRCTHIESKLTALPLDGILLSFKQIASVYEYTHIRFGPFCGWIDNMQANKKIIQIDY